MIDIVVYGSARPQGGLAIGTANDGRQFLRHKSDSKLREWRTAIADKAGAAMVSEATRDAVRVNAVFYIARPKGHYGKRGLLPSAPAYPTTRTGGDIDKLARSLLDALTGICFADDSQVVDLRVRKRFADDIAVCAQIAVSLLGDELDVALAAAAGTP